MARAIEVPVVVKKGSLSRSIEGEALTAAKRLGGSGSRAVQPLGRMLGKIRADADEFTKSIEASNARVIAFGASVAVINGISRAFKELIATTVRVEKTLTDINVVLNTSQANLQKFGDGIFKVAKNTAQSFEVAAEAALEFSRQGLSTEETLKRVNDALVLTRLTGLKASESVKGLTAAVNGFGKAGLTTTQIINKLSAVDVKFAVGTDDLIAALSRAGAVAQDAGVNFDELVAMVTVAQQKTARGGAVIGNAFKTIYTRMQDPRALNALREVGIAVDSQTGAALPANKALQNLAATYDTLTRTQKASIDQFVAGKFQINILKAALGDLGKANSDYTRAQQVSANATDQAIQKNKQLNQTASALASQTGVAVEQLVKKIGDISVGPGIKNLLTTINSLVEGMTKGLEGEGMGAKFAKGLLKGIGGVLTGPGLVVVGGVFIKLFKDLVVFGTKSLKNLLGLNNAAKQQAAIQQGIGQLLAKNVAYEQAMAAASGNVAKQQAITNTYLMQEVKLRQQAAGASAGLAMGAYRSGFRVSGSGAIKRRGVPGFAPAGGMVPNFAFMTMGRLMSRLGTAKGAVGEGKGGLMTSIIGTGAELGVVGATGRGPRAYDASMFSKRGVRETLGADLPQGDVKASLIGGASGFQWTKKGKERKDGTRPIVIGQGARFLRQGAISITPFTGFRDAGKLSGALKTGGYDYMPSGVKDKLEKIMAGKKLGFGGSSAAEKEALFGGAGGVGAQIRESLGARGRSATPARAIASAFDMDRFLLEYFKNMGKSMGMKGGFVKGRKIDSSQVEAILGHSSYKASGELSRQAAADAMNTIMPASQRRHQRWIGKGYTPFMAPNFSPLSDAISREKNQVGMLMGISPSSVQTRVVQNAALRSSFNPQGFGVISPTVGQNTFADAAKMHRGENLQTANLPSFATLPTAAEAAARRFPGTPVNPWTTASKTVDVRIVDEKTSVTEKRAETTEKARERRPSTWREKIVGRKEGLRVSGMRGYMARTSAGRTMASRLPAAGGAMAGPLMMGAFMAPMAEGFIERPTPMQRAGMNMNQRRRADQQAAGKTGAIVGAFGGYGITAGILSMLQKAPNPLIKAGAYGLGMIGGAGAGYAVGAKTDLFTKPFMSSGERMQVSGVVSDRENEQIEGLTQIQPIINELRAATPGSEKEQSLLKEYNRIKNTITDQKTKDQLDNILGGRKITLPNRKHMMFQQKLGQYTGAGPGAVAAAQGLPPSVLQNAPLTETYQGVGPSLRALVAEKRVTGAGKVAKQQLLARMIEMGGEGDITEWGGGLGQNFSLKEPSIKIGHKLSPVQKTELDKSMAQTLAASPEFAEVWKVMTDQRDLTGTAGMLAAGDIGFGSISGAADSAALGVRGDIEKVLMEIFDITRNEAYLLRERLEIISQDLPKAKQFGEAVNKGIAVQQQTTKALQEGQAEQQAIIDNFKSISDNARTQARLLDDMNRLQESTMQISKIGVSARAGIMPTLGFSQAEVAGYQARRNIGFARSGGGMQREGLEAQSRRSLSRLIPSLPKTQSGLTLTRVLEQFAQGGGTAEGIRGVSDLLAQSRGQGLAFKDGQLIRGAKGGEPGAFSLEDQQLTSIVSWLDTLSEGRRVIDDNTNALIKRIKEEQRLAELFEKHGTLLVGIEAFRTELGSAFSDFAMNAKTGSEALQDFGFNLLAAINRKVMQDFANNITESLFGNVLKNLGTGGNNQRGGIIGAQNGMYISSGAPSGDSVPAMLEKGEYVLNRNLVNRIGKKNLDSANFGMVPRLTGGSIGMQTGGVSPFDTASKSVKKELSERFGAGIMGTGYSSYAYFKDPQFIRARKLAEEKAAEEAQKRFESQAKKDAMWKMAATTALTMGINAGIGKMANAGKPDAGESMLNPPETAAAPSLSWLQRLKAYTKKTWGKQAWKDAFNFSGDKQIGGHIDNIPAMLTAGEYVVGRNAVQKYGTGFLGNINRMQHGGPVGGGAFVQGEGATGGSTAPTTNNNNVSISVNFAKDGGAEVKSVEDSASDDPRKFAGKIREAVMNVINEEKRVGGSLRNRGRRGG